MIALRTPLPIDVARAEAFVTVEYDECDTISPAWLRMHRADLVRQVAVAEMQKRENAELKASPVGPLAREAVATIQAEAA